MYVEAPCGRNYIHPSTPEGYFQGWGVYKIWPCKKGAHDLACLSGLSLAFLRPPLPTLSWQLERQIDDTQGNSGCQASLELPEPSVSRSSASSARAFGLAYLPEHLSRTSANRET